MLPMPLMTVAFATLGLWVWWIVTSKRGMWNDNNRVYYSNQVPTNTPSLSHPVPSLQLAPSPPPARLLPDATVLVLLSQSHPPLTTRCGVRRMT